MLEIKFKCIQAANEEITAFNFSDIELSFSKLNLKFVSEIVVFKQGEKKSQMAFAIFI